MIEMKWLKDGHQISEVWVGGEERLDDFTVEVPWHLYLCQWNDFVFISDPKQEVTLPTTEGRIKLLKDQSPGTLHI